MKHAKTNLEIAKEIITNYSRFNGAEEAEDIGFEKWSRTPDGQRLIEKMFFVDELNKDYPKDWPTLLGIPPERQAVITIAMAVSTTRLMTGELGRGEAVSWAIEKSKAQSAAEITYIACMVYGFSEYMKTKQEIIKQN